MSTDPAAVARAAANLEASLDDTDIQRVKARRRAQANQIPVRPQIEDASRQVRETRIWRVMWALHSRCTVHTDQGPLPAHNIETHRADASVSVDAIFPDQNIYF